jgi:hypothetical protein
VFYSGGGVDSVSSGFIPSSEIFFVSNVSNQKFVGEKLFKSFDVQPVDTSTSRLNFGPLISKIGSFFHPFPYPTIPLNKDISCFTTEYGKVTHTDMYGLYCYSDSTRGYPAIMNDYITGGFDRERPYCLNVPDTVIISNENKMPISKNTSTYKLYPNPVLDEVCIVSEKNTVIKKIKILNTKGEEVLTILGNRRRMSTTALPVGVYLMRITDDEGRWETLKFVKIK